MVLVEEKKAEIYSTAGKRTYWWLPLSGRWLGGGEKHTKFGELYIAWKYGVLIPVIQILIGFNANLYMDSAF